MLTKPSTAVEEGAAQELHGIERHDALTAAVAIRGQFIEPRRGAEIGSRTSTVEHALRWSWRSPSMNFLRNAVRMKTAD